LLERLSGARDASNSNAQFTVIDVADVIITTTPGVVMNRTTRWLLGAAGAVLLLFGLLCLNYTKADGLERHREVARRHGLPQPSNAILYGGVVAVVLGSGMIGYLLGARKRGIAVPAP
jgi:cytochrome c biogenesis protein CcdA